mgnify:CR=1 FL=1
MCAAVIADEGAGARIEAAVALRAVVIPGTGPRLDAVGLVDRTLLLIDRLRAIGRATRRRRRVIVNVVVGLVVDGDRAAVDIDAALRRGGQCRANDHTGCKAKDASGNFIVINAASYGMRAGDTLVVIELPFASVSNLQPVIPVQNPKGETVYWIGPPGGAKDAGPGTDFYAITQGKVSVSCLKADLTHVEQMKVLAAWL